MSDKSDLQRMEELYELHKSALERDYFGQHVMFNAETGEYVVGKTQQEVSKRAEEKFGRGTRRFMMGIGFHYRVGWGINQLFR